MDQDKTIVPLVSVTFIASSSPYHPPDVAGFPKHEADALVKAGKARYTEQAGDDADRSEADRLAAEKAEADRLAAEKAEADRLAAEKAELDRLAAEQAEAERLAAEQAAAEQAEADRLAAEKAAAEQTASASAGKGKKG